MPIGIWADAISGDEVAILPYVESTTTEVLGIQTIEEIGSAFIQLSDGSVFTRAGGLSVNGNTCIVPATAQHKAVMEAKSKLPA